MFSIIKKIILINFNCSFGQLENIECKYKRAFYVV